MRVSVLVVRFQGEDRITLHDDDGSAWSALVEFVDENWGAAAASAILAQPVSAEDSVAMFFARFDASYVLGVADLSKVEARIDDLIASGQCPLCGDTRDDPDIS